MSVLPVASDDTDDLFAETDGLGERESAPVPLVIDSANQPIPEAATETEQSKNTSTQT